MVAARARLGQAALAVEIGHSYAIERGLLLFAIASL